MITIPCYKGHYDWNPQTNGLEFVSSDKDLGNDGLDRKKRNKGTLGVPVLQIPNVSKERATPSKSMHGFISSSAGNQGMASRGRGAGQRASPRLGVLRNDNSTVSLFDVKSVALSQLNSDREQSGTRVSLSFKELLHTQQFNNFLVTLLRYFDCFFEGLDQQKRPHKTSYLEPSKAELNAMEEISKRMKGTKRHLGQAYCVLLLGIGLEKQHHMGCGRQRVSSTHRDKRMYEDLYAFCTMLIWVTFRRRELDRISMEVGDMLRSPVYNPAIRQTRHEALGGEATKFHKPYVKKATKPIAERVEELLAVKLPQIEKLTPAQHRRMHGKRPAIMKAIHQRSSALVSLLPLPHEESAHLFKSSLQNQAKEDADVDKLEEKLDSLILHQEFYPVEKIGIIGEPLELFNPENLLPKNMDNEDDADSRDEESPMLRSNASQQSDNDASKHRPLSRTTTEDSIHG